MNSVTLRGNVAAPGRYPWHEGMRISDLIPNREFLITREYWSQQNAINLQAQASGARPGAALNDVRRNAPEINWDYAVIQRMSSKDLSTELVPFNLGKAVLEHEDSSNLRLQPGDIVTIFSQADLRVPREQQTKLVRLEGEFASAGIYRAQPGQKLRDLVAESRRPGVFSLSLRRGFHSRIHSHSAAGTPGHGDRADGAGHCAPGGAVEPERQVPRMKPTLPGLRWKRNGPAWTSFAS